MTDQEVDLIIPNNDPSESSTAAEPAELPNPPEEINIPTDPTEASSNTKTTEDTITYNATQYYPTGGISSKDTETVALPTDYASSVKDVLNELPNINFTDTQESREWVNVLNEGLEYVPMQEMFKDTVNAAKNGEFTQRLEYNGKPLIAASPKFDKLENNILKGEKAVIRVLQTLGLGNLFQVPLWHTGIWVTLKPPTEAEIIELNRQLLNDKIQFGRYTYGLAFANTTSYTVDRLLTFVLDHIYNTTLKTDTLTADDLRKLISSQDIPILLWGIACTIYPNGFKYKRACISNPERCTHVIEETINVTKLLWTNVNHLTDYQKEHMSSRQARSRTIEQVERYKDELKAIHKARVKLDNDKDIYLTIRSPSVKEYIESGYVWINSIVESVERTISTEATQSEKDNLITRYAQASRLRQYGHWIESIEVETNISNDQETINELLDVLSSDNELFSTIMLKIKAYINNSVISLVGIQSYNCPACSGEQKDETYPKFTNILPLDVQQLFFGLFTQRLIRLTDR
jgi:hypothetical protein